MGSPALQRRLESRARLQTAPIQLSSLIDQRAVSGALGTPRRARVHLEARRGMVLKQRPHTRRGLPRLRRLVRLGPVTRLLARVDAVTRVVFGAW